MKRIYAFIAALGMVAFSACQNEDDLTESNVGYLTLEVGTDNTTITKAEEAYDPEQIAVQIIDATGKVVKETEDYTTWTEAIALTPGKYKISASSNGFDGKSAAFDKPYYAGLDSVTIVKGEDAKKTVTCKLANVLVTVEFDDAFKAAFKTAEIDVIDTLNASTSLSFTKETAETMKGYFPVTGMFADLVVTNQKGTQHSRRDTVRDVKARDNVILRYHVAESETGSSTIDVTLDGSTRTFIYTIGVPTVAQTTLTASEANAWSNFAYLEGSYTFVGIPDKSKFAFEYQADGASDWTKVSSLEEGENNTFTAKVTGLTASTKYKYRLVYGESEYASSEVEFTTEEAIPLYNGDFEAWNYGTGDYSSTWFADFAQAQPGYNFHAGFNTSFWDSGNIGTSTGMASLLGAKNPTSPEEKIVHTPGGKSAKLASEYVVIQFAAGNIYAGNYQETIMSPMGARINWGQPFTSRPTALHGWIQYTPGEVNRGEDGNLPADATLHLGDTDQNAIYIALSDKGSQYEINNGEKKFVDFENDPNIIAYGELPQEECVETDGWKEVNIPLVYRALDRKPTHIIIVFSASKYGDYFVGSDKSVMYIDDFELVYGDSPVVEEKTETEE